AARLAWNRMPRKPCCARLPESGAGTFAPLCGAKVTAFLKAVEKVLGLFRQPEPPCTLRGGFRFAVAGQKIFSKNLLTN
ncbi:hypothetical protein, partial [uncultured Pseudoflavonifractor sp.]|uniref:hypothetical protein n=1 Tax=uncultured Pseudoflavonifractor sp. TaxID=1221379 RepID=UPI0025CF05C2